MMGSDASDAGELHAADRWNGGERRSAYMCGRVNLPPSAAWSKSRAT